MSFEIDFMRVVLALQMGFITREQMIECGALWIADRKKSLTEILAEKKYLLPPAEAALDAMVRAKVDACRREAGQTQAGPAAEEAVRRSLLATPLGSFLESTLKELEATVAKKQTAFPPREAFTGDTTVDAPPEEPSGTPGRVALLRAAESDRYDFKSELGRGSLGKVVEAVDRDFGREVAVKLMLPGSPPSAVERFLFEGKAAGRLPHPNIVPVYEIGSLEGESGASPYFTMAKIVGRNLKEILDALRKGDEKTSKHFNRPRLLRIFQDVCNAMAFAHDHHVIHRDLKPANVMIGDYGEVFVVDWGLAKMKGSRESSCPDPPGPASREAGSPEKGPPAGAEITSSDCPSCTIEGDVLGTPAYMPPEQAAGRIDEVDAQSDLYSLGAILYELLTLLPPFSGETVQEVLSKVLKEDVVPPSARLSCSLLASTVQLDRDSKLPRVEAIHPDLDEIVMRALSRDKKKRFAAAQDLSEAVRLFLEGEKERERNHRQALAKVAEGKKLAARLPELRSALKNAEKKVIEERLRIPRHWPLEKKTGLWAWEDEVNRLRLEIADSFTEAGNTLQEALGFERLNPEARAALADLYWDRYLRELESGSAAEVLHFEKMVRRYNDGQYDARLKGDGTLSVSTRFFPCRCLLDGRLVAPEDLCGEGEEREKEAPAEEGGKSLSEPFFSPLLRPSKRGVMGFHPLSGRDLRGLGASEGLAELEPEEPIRLRVHGAGCGTEPLEGAEVWLFSFVEKDRILVPALPVLPASAEAPAGQAGPPGMKGSAGAGKEDSAPRNRAEDRKPGSIGIPPEHVLDRLYDPKSPFRPSEGLYLGKTPIAPFQIPMGSYLLIIARRTSPQAPGGPAASKPAGSGQPGISSQDDQAWAPVRFPVFIDRNATEALEVTLYRESEIPAGFVQIPGGKFTCQGDRENPFSDPKKIWEPGDFFLRRFPVTCREYLEFLNDLAPPESPGAPPGRTGQAERKLLLGPAEKHVPRRSEGGFPYWPRDGAGKYAIPTEEWLAGAPEELKKQARRLAQAPVDWHEDWPVFSVSWNDAMAFCAWRVEKGQFLVTLPTEIAWEKAARGVDARIFPFGNCFDDLYANTLGTHGDSPRPCPVDSFPVDESPYGARGLCGNSVDWCLDEIEGGRRRFLRGGSWIATGLDTRAASLSANPPTNAELLNGFRLFACVKL